MSVALRPHTKLAAALMTAGVVAAGPTVTGTSPEALPVLSNVAVHPTSLITDALYGAGDVVSAVADTFLIGTDLALGLNYYWDDSDFGYGVPTNPLFFAVAAAQNPGSALSWLAQTYLNPSDNYANYSYPWYFKSAVIEPLVGLLPAALSSPVLDAINGVANSINVALSSLPDPTPAVDSLWYQYDTVAGSALYALQSAIALPVTLLTAATYYLAYLPATVEATVESAIRQPADIPGLVSNLVWDALDPNLYGGLLGNVSYNLFKPAFFLPAPIGDTSIGAHDGLAYNAYQGFANAVTGLLSLLPTPVAPTPFAAAASSATSAAASPAAAEDGGSVAAESPAVDQVGEGDGAKTAAPSPVAADAHARVRSGAKASAPNNKAAAPDRTSARESKAAKSEGNSTASQSKPAHSSKKRNAA